MVVETRFEILSDCLIPTTTWGHRSLRCLPPLLRFTGTELVVNVEKLRGHEAIVILHILN
ncbi:hypothetical protein SynA1560_00691 [Synechococcus sp. A15-60]|nr:hypothetical protein SynA1560_00691 [Synechococcus sp. A15-60]